MNNYQSLYQNKDSKTSQKGKAFCIDRPIDWNDLIEEINNNDPNWYSITAKEIEKDINRKLIRKIKNKLNGKCK